MADKRISQLVDRGTVANNDVVPIVVSGAVTTNKATISSIQTFMQGNLDLGVTSVGITLGSSGTDVSVTGSPITTSGNITINIPSASASARGLVTTGTQTFAGLKFFNDGINVGNTIVANTDIQLITKGTALNTFITNINATGLTSIGANGFGFNNANNIYFSGSNKGGGILAFSNTGNQTYTLPNASGTLAFTSDLTGFVTLGTAQTITAQKTFTGSGGSDTMIISHGSGSGFALDVIKAGNGEVIRVLKTSGSGNAMTVQGGNFEAPTIVKTGGTSAQFLMADGSVNTSVLASGAYLPLTGGTLTGALNGTSAVFSSTVSATQYTATSTGGSGLRVYGGSGTNQWDIYLNSTNLRFSDNTGTGNIVFDRPLNGTSASFTSTTEASNSSTASVVLAGGLGVAKNIRTSQNIIAEGVAGTIAVLNGGDFQVYTSGNANYSSISSPSSGNMVLKVNIGATPINALTLASTGAATFSSSVTANGRLQVISGFADQIRFGTNTSVYTNISMGTGFTVFDSIGGDAGAYDFRDDGQSRLFINSSGNVGIGTSSPDQIGYGAGTILGILSPSTDATNLQLGIVGSSGATSGTLADINFFGRNGTGSVVSRAILRGGIDGATNSNFISAWTMNAGTLQERMRITSGGYLKASNDGTYHASAGSVHELRTNVGGNYSAFISNTHPSSPFGLVVYYPNTINNTSSRFLDCEDNTAIRFSVRSNGGLANYQANDVNLSDERTKKDIEPLKSYWDKFKAIEIVKFKYKDQTHDDFNIGVIAQQVEAVAPEFVDVDGWDVKPKLDEEGNEIVSEEEPLKSIYTADLHHATIKVLQEAMAKIEKLETEIDSLKNQMQ